MAEAVSSNFARSSALGHSRVVVEANWRFDPKDDRESMEAAMTAWLWRDWRIMDLPRGMS